MFISATVLFVTALASSGGSGANPTVIVDAYRAPICRLPVVEAACVRGEAKFHLETQPGTDSVVASVILVTPATFSSWAECTAKKWNEISPEAVVDDQHNATIKVSVSNLGSAGEPCQDAR